MLSYDQTEACADCFAEICRCPEPIEMPLVLPQSLLDTGLVQCSVKLASPTSVETWSGSEDKGSDALRQEDSIGSSSLRSPSPKDFPLSNVYAETDTGSPLGN